MKYLRLAPNTGAFMPLLRSFTFKAFTLTAILLTLPACVISTLASGAATVSNTINDERSLGRQFDDAVIASKIDARLIAERDMPSRWVSVEVIRGEATLIGHLPSQTHIERAIYITKQINGVDSVHNKIEIGSPKMRTVMSDTWITTRIKRQFWNDKLVSGFKIHVETVNGKVYLQGIVNRLIERQRAKDIARKTPGVTAVIDMMRSGK